MTATSASTGMHISRRRTCRRSLRARNGCVRAVFAYVDCNEERRYRNQNVWHVHEEIGDGRDELQMPNGVDDDVSRIKESQKPKVNA